MVQEVVLCLVVWSPCSPSLSPSLLYCYSRLAFALANIDYQDERVELEAWKELKPKTPFGQLPLLQIGNNGPTQTQSMAMLRWVGAQDVAGHLYPVTTDASAAYAIEEALGVLQDFKNSWTPCLYLTRNPQLYGHAADLSDDDKKALVKNVREYWLQDSLPRYLKDLQTLLDKHNGVWLASSTAPTIADCVAVPFLRSFTKGHVDYVPTDVLDQYPAIKSYVQRFCATAVPGRYKDGLHE